MQGFYKYNEGKLLFAESIIAPNFTLVAEDKETYTFPVNGWYWFDSEQEAKDTILLGKESYNLNGWKSRTCNFRIVAPIALVNSYPELLFDLAVTRKLQIEQEGSDMHIYCNYIDPDHQVLIDASQGIIYVEQK